MGKDKLQRRFSLLDFGYKPHISDVSAKKVCASLERAGGHWPFQGTGGILMEEFSFACICAEGRKDCEGEATEVGSGGMGSVLWILVTCTFSDICKKQIHIL